MPHAPMLPSIHACHLLHMTCELLQSTGARVGNKIRTEGPKAARVQPARRGPAAEAVSGRHGLSPCKRQGLHGESHGHGNPNPGWSARVVVRCVLCALVDVQGECCAAALLEPGA